MELHRYLVALVKSQTASLAAWASGAPGMQFDGFGRRIGTRLAALGERKGVRLLINPVSILRYFEFPFALECIRGNGFARCLDVGSPFLFSLYACSKGIVQEIDVINPDGRDIEATRSVLGKLGWKGIHTAQSRIEDWDSAPPYDGIWSISVVEHIPGDLGDSGAMSKMFSLLRPGGRLVITVPVDREYHVENRREDVYELGVSVRETGLRFFQRVYSGVEIHKRLVNSVGVDASEIRWFGEKVKGTYAAYETRWLQNGFIATATDSWRIAREYREFEKWEDMPGMGVCGLVFDKSIN